MNLRKLRAHLKPFLCKGEGCRHRGDYEGYVCRKHRDQSKPLKSSIKKSTGVNYLIRRAIALEKDPYQTYYRKNGNGEFKLRRKR